jgi:AAA+ ATPase superfamily predicted ATPase
MKTNEEELLVFSERFEQLVLKIEEATRASQEGTKRFIEPHPGTLNRALSKRHHIIFGRRGSGKSSLLNKAANSLSLGRQPVAYVDLETFKGHSYPDVLTSVMIEAFGKFVKWLDTVAINPTSKRKWWETLFGGIPEKRAVNREEAKRLRIALEPIRKKPNRGGYEHRRGE